MKRGIRVEIERELGKRLQIYCIINDTTPKEVVENMVRKFLKGAKK